MSIQSEVERISTNVQNTLEAIRQTGVSVPENATSDALPAAAAALANEKQDKLTGSQGQVVGFDAEGNAVAQEMPASGGKRMARFVVGTSAAGWTAADCDYLCDGTGDQVEINTAIQALPSTGGEIVLLDGTYNITATIAMNKDNVKLSGNGAATVLKRMWNSSASSEGIITTTGQNCTIGYLNLAGKRSGPHNDNLILGSTNIAIGNICTGGQEGIHASGNCSVIGNLCSNNSWGIVAVANNNTISGNNCCDSPAYAMRITGDSNAVTGNTCSDGRYGIEVTGTKNTIAGNVCNDNSSSGIRLSGAENNTIVGNTCVCGTGKSSDYDSNQYTIYLTGSNNNYNLIAHNNIMGKNYTSSGGTGNTFDGNKYN